MKRDLADVLREWRNTAIYS